MNGFLGIAYAADSGIVQGLNNIIPGGLGNIINLGLMFGALLGLGVVIYAGILFSMSGDNSSKQKEAKEWIWAAVKGLAVLAFGYLLIVVINPSLTTVKEIDIVDPPTPEISTQPIGTRITPGARASYKNVPLVKQGGGSWGGKIYGRGAGCNNNYAGSGCGPTSIAMAILYLTGNKYMTESDAVVTVGDDIVNRGMRICGQGTARTAVEVIPQKYGLSTSNVNSKSGISACIDKGGVVIGLMRGVTDSEEAALKKTDQNITPIFTTGGHYIVVTGIDTDDNMLFINDPGGRNITSSNADHYFKYEKESWCISK